MRRPGRRCGRARVRTEPAIAGGLADAAARANASRHGEAALATGSVERAASCEHSAETRVPGHGCRLARVGRRSRCTRLDGAVCQTAAGNATGWGTESGPRGRKARQMQGSVGRRKWAPVCLRKGGVIWQHDIAAGSLLQATSARWLCQCEAWQVSGAGGLPTGGVIWPRQLHPRPYMCWARQTRLPQCAPTAKEGHRSAHNVVAGCRPRCAARPCLGQQRSE